MGCRGLAVAWRERAGAEGAPRWCSKRGGVHRDEAGFGGVDPARGGTPWRARREKPGVRHGVGRVGTPLASPWVSIRRHVGASRGNDARRFLARPGRGGRLRSWALETTTAGD